MRGITLERFEQTVTALPDGREGFAVRLLASGGLNMPDEIFLCQLLTLDPESNDHDVQLLGVCSGFDILTYPAGIPDPPSAERFRLADVTIVLPSQAVVRDFWEGTQRRVDILVDQLNNMDELIPTETVRIGDSEDDSA